MTDTLFEEGPDSLEAAFLLGGSCCRCGYNFFPMQAYGCEQCGSTELVERKFAARGKLASHAVVYVHPDPNLPPPFTIGSIELDSGVTVRAIVDEAPDAGLRVGERVVGLVVSEANPERGRFDLRFRREGAGA